MKKSQSFFCKINKLENLALSENKLEDYPLKSVKYDLKIKDYILSGILELFFINNSKNYKDFLHFFPIPHEAAVFKCEMIKNGNILTADLSSAGNNKTKQTNEGTFDFVLDKARGNICRLFLKNLQAGEKCSVKIYLTYPVFPTGHQRIIIPVVLPESIADRTSGKTIVFTGSSNSLPEFNIKFEIFDEIKLKKIYTCNYYTTIIQDNKTIITSTDRDEKPVAERDFHLLFDYKRMSQKDIKIFKIGEDKYELKIIKLKKESKYLPAEYIFLIDLNIRNFKRQKEIIRTIRTFIRRLRPTDKFNIILSGNRIRSFTQKSGFVLPETVRKAVEFINVNFDQKETNLVNSLTSVLKLKVPMHYSRKVFVFSDLKVPDSDQVIDLVQSNKKIQFKFICSDLNTSQYLSSNLNSMNNAELLYPDKIKNKKTIISTLSKTDKQPAQEIINNENLKYILALEKVRELRNSDEKDKFIKTGKILEDSGILSSGNQFSLRSNIQIPAKNHEGFYVLPAVISSSDKELFNLKEQLFYKNKNYRIKPSALSLRKLFLKRVLRQKKKKLEYETFDRQKREVEKLKGRSFLDYKIDFSIFSYEHKKYEDVRSAINSKLPSIKKVMRKVSATNIIPYASVWLLFNTDPWGEALNIKVLTENSGQEYLEEKIKSIIKKTHFPESISARKNTIVAVFDFSIINKNRK